MSRLWKVLLVVFALNAAFIGIMFYMLPAFQDSSLGLETNFVVPRPSKQRKMENSLEKLKKKITKEVNNNLPSQEEDPNIIPEGVEEQMSDIKSSVNEINDIEASLNSSCSQNSPDGNCASIENTIIESTTKQNVTTNVPEMIDSKNKTNPFKLLGAYPEMTLEYFNTYPDDKPKYNVTNYGLIHNDSYCDAVDKYNIKHPEIIFQQENFFTDYYHHNQEMVRHRYISQFVNDTMKNIFRDMPKEDFNKSQYHLAPEINNYFTKRVDLHAYHEVGKHFLCATQMYNHIPGHGALKRKDANVESIAVYNKRYLRKPECFNKNQFYPESFRLYDRVECRRFFNIIRSEKYKESLKEHPVQFLTKVGFASHKASGINIVDANHTDTLLKNFRNGTRCGKLKTKLVAQRYIKNPLLLDYENKFDFRVYMLIASTNPLIVYYHDGFLRVALEEYNKFSSNKTTHLTNTFVAKGKFEEARLNSTKFFNMDEEQLRDYHIWDLERLQTYLLQSKKIDDPNWLDNYLRPAFHKAFIHLVRMSSSAFWNESNVYEFYGLDFMLDSDLNLWFLECNSSPQFVETNDRSLGFLNTMLKDMFEIQYAYYRSRMKRVLRVIKSMRADIKKNGSTDLQVWRRKYKFAVKNRLEPEYSISTSNSFTLIMDQNKKGAEAYLGNVPAYCLYKQL